MTAKKSSLLARNVLYQDFNDTNALLAPGNINRNELLNYARDAAKWTTGNENNTNHSRYIDYVMVVKSTNPLIVLFIRVGSKVCLESLRRT